MRNKCGAWKCILPITPRISHKHLISNWFNNPSQQLRLPPCVKLSQLSKTFTADFYEEMKWKQDNQTSINTQHLGLQVIFLWLSYIIMKKAENIKRHKNILYVNLLDNWFVLMNIINMFHIIKWWSLIWFLYHTFVYDMMVICLLMGGQS